MSQEGFIRVIYDAGIDTELFPAADLHRHRRHDGLRSGPGPALDLPPGRGRPVRDLPDPASGPGPGLSPARCGLDRDHRGLRRPDGHLRDLEIRPATAGRRVGGGLLLHVAGADHPAADHAAPDDEEGADDGHEAGRPSRSPRRRSCSSPWSSRSSAASSPRRACRSWGRSCSET